MPTAPKQNTAETPAERQIERAKALEFERGDLMLRITKNREYLRLMDANDELTEEQGAWLDAFYPEKTKGTKRSAEDIENTRRVKLEARKGLDAPSEDEDENGD